jgi:hypothetical protein
MPRKNHTDKETAPGPLHNYGTLLPVLDILQTGRNQARSSATTLWDLMFGERELTTTKFHGAEISYGTPILQQGRHVQSGRDSSTSNSCHLLISAVAEALKPSRDRVPSQTEEPPIAKRSWRLERRSKRTRLSLTLSGPPHPHSPPPGLHPHSARSQRISGTNQPATPTRSSCGVGLQMRVHSAVQTNWDVGRGNRSRKLGHCM